MPTSKTFLALAFATAALGATVVTQGQAIAVEFTASRNPVPVATSTLLTWNAEGATSCTASGHPNWNGTKPPSGTFEFTLQRDFTLTLECRNGARTGSAQLALTTIKATYTRPTSIHHWMSIPTDLDADGSEEIVMTTMDAGKVNEFTPATPIAVLAARDGLITDRSSTLFPSGVPRVFSGKMVSGDFDGDGLMDLMSCDRGRNAGTMPPGDSLGTLGIWRGKNQVFLQRGGAFADVTSAAPDTIGCYWGCSASSVDGPGRASSLVVSAFFPGPTYSGGYLLRWNGSRFDLTQYLAPRGSWDLWGWSQGGDFNRDGFGDVVGARRVLFGGPQYRDVALPLSKAEQAGFTFLRGSLAADFTGDGIQDLVRTSSLSDSTLSGVRFAMFAGAPGTGLAEKQDAFPDLAAYPMADFPNELNAVDVNFDGFLDIAAFGTVYSFSREFRPPTAVWLNDGTGRFTFARWSDVILPSDQTSCPQYQAYFLKTADPQVFNLVVGTCGGQYTSRPVTPAFPLTFTR